MTDPEVVTALRVLVEHTIKQTALLEAMLESVDELVDLVEGAIETPEEGEEWKK